MIHEDIQLTGSFQASGSFTLPNHANTASAILQTGSIYNDTTDNVVKVYNGTEWVIVGSQTQPITGVDIEYLVIAGGAGGGDQVGGGGGAGGYLSSSLSIESGSTVTVTIGGGGAGGYGDNSQQIGVNGTNSSLSSSVGTDFSTITAIGGGGGSGYTGYPANDGGSGGGGSGTLAGSPSAAGSGTVGQGNDGGAGTQTSWSGGGGGGAGAAGSDGSTASSGTGGAGGTGKASSITGTSVTRAGGGGGCGNSGGAGVIGAGGTGGGGAGGANTGVSAQSATANTGGGGGGARDAGDGGAGGSGVIILAYDSGSINAVGGLVGDAGGGRKYHQFNTSGTWKVGSPSDFQIVTDGLVAHWDATSYDSYQGSNSTWYDLSGNGNNLTANNSPSWNSAGYWTMGSTGYFSNSGGVNIPSGNSNYTLLIWTRLSSWGDKGFMSIGGFATANQSNAFRAYNGGLGQMSHYWWANDLVVSNNNASLATNTWFMAVATFNGTTRSVYGNTTLVGSDAPTGHNVTNTNINVGLTYDTEYNTGDIAIAMIYNKGLTASEVAQNYEATKTNFV